MHGHESDSGSQNKRFSLEIEVLPCHAGIQVITSEKSVAGSFTPGLPARLASHPNGAETSDCLDAFQFPLITLPGIGSIEVCLLRWISQ